MITVFINNNKYMLPKNITILTACQLINEFIPKFCFDYTLEISGNCRMCLVEVKGFINPIMSCTFKIFNNINILTNSPLVKKSRENILEFLLINHPLDCPICDQGGECDLQDLSMSYGSDKSRFLQNKKTVEDLENDFFIKTIMTRCILCTKCVRFMDLILNNKNNLGVIGRGKNMEIGFYIKSNFLSNFSSNIVDLCPVGALLLKPTSFVSRNWYIKKYNSFDFLDSVCSDVVIQVSNNKILKIVPNINLNVEYLSNFSRFFFYDLQRNRILQSKLICYNRKLDTKTEFQLSAIESSKIIKSLFKKNDASLFKFIISADIDLKSLLSLYLLLNQFSLFNVNSLESVYTGNYDITSNFLINKSNILNFKKIVYILIDCDLSIESPSLFLMLNKKLKKNEIEVLSLGFNNPFSKSLGFSLEILIKILEGKHEICKKLKNNGKFFLIFGKSFFLNINNHTIIDYIKNKCNNFINIFNIYNLNLLNFSEVFGNSIKLKFLKNYKILYLYNTKNFLKYLNVDYNINNLFIIYHGTHKTKDYFLADLIIPSFSFYEKSNKYLNLFGDLKKSNQIINYFVSCTNHNFFFEEYLLFTLLTSKSKKLYKNFKYLNETRVFISCFNFSIFSKLNYLKIKKYI